MLWRGGGGVGENDWWWDEVRGGKLDFVAPLPLNRLTILRCFKSRLVLEFVAQDTRPHISISIYHLIDWSRFRDAKLVG